MGNFHQQFGEDEFHFDLYCKSWGCFTKPKRLFSPNQKIVFGLAKIPTKSKRFLGQFSRGLLVPTAVQATCLEEAIPVSERQNLVPWLLNFFFGFHFGKKAPNIGSLLSKNEHWFNCSWSWVCIPNVFFFCLPKLEYPSLQNERLT